MNRPWAKQVHPLAQDDQPCGIVKFIHFEDGKEHCFGFAANRLTGNMMHWFDTSMFRSDIPYVKSVVRDIYKKATKVISHVGDFKP